MANNENNNRSTSNSSDESKDSPEISSIHTQETFLLEDDQSEQSMHDFNHFLAKDDEVGLLTAVDLSIQTQKWLIRMDLQAEYFAKKGLLKELNFALTPKLWGRIVHWIMTVSWAEKLGFYLLLTYKSLNPDLEEPDILNKHLWLQSGVSALPLQSEIMQKRVFATQGGFAGFEYFQRVWALFVFSLFFNSLGNYIAFPEERQVSLGRYLLVAYTNSVDYLAKSLREVTVWPVLIGVPAVLMSFNALWQYFQPRITKDDDLQQLLRQLKSYKSHLWNDAIRWLFSSLTPNMVPAFFPAMFFYLLPGPHIQYLLERCTQLILWDGRLTKRQRKEILQAFQDLHESARYFTQLATLSTFADLANGIGLWDLEKLKTAKVNEKTIQQLLTIQLDCLNRLHYAAKHYYSPNKDKQFFLSPLPRYLFAHYLLWTLGYSKSLWLEPLFFLYRSTRLLTKILLALALYKGLYNEIRNWVAKQKCEGEGKVWTYFNQYIEYRCTVCGDWPVFIGNMFDVQSCIADYLGTKRSVSEIVDALERAKRLNFGNMAYNLAYINLSQQRFNNSELTKILNILTPSRSYVLEGTTLSLRNSLVIDSNGEGLNAIGAQAIATLLNNSAVEGLVLSHTGLRDHDAANILAEAFYYSDFFILNMSHNPFSDSTIKAIAPSIFKYRNKLWEVDLSHTNFGDEGAKIIAQALAAANSEIQKLYLNNNNITDEGIAAIAQALPNSTLWDLYFRDNKITSKGLEALLQTLLNSNHFSDELDLSNNAITDDGVKIIAQVLQEKPNLLFSVSLSNNAITDTGAKMLAKVMPNSMLALLDLSNNAITDNGAIAIAQALLKSPCLNHLNLSNNSISDDGAIALAEVLISSRIGVSLALSSNGITDKGAIAIAQALPSSQLQSLDLSSNTMGKQGIIAIARALPNSELNALYLSNNAITDDSVTVIAEYLTKSQLYTLDLSNNNIGNLGVTAIAKALPLSQLSTLELSNNVIANEGAKTLASTLTVNVYTPKPLWVSFFDKQVWDAKYISGARVNTNLDTLNLDNNLISTDGAKALCKHLLKSGLSIGKYFDDDGDVQEGFSMQGNPIDFSVVNIRTCVISRANHLSPPLFYRFVYLSTMQIYYDIKGLPNHIANHFEVQNLFGFFGQVSNPVEMNGFVQSSPLLLINGSTDLIGQSALISEGFTAIATPNPIGLISAYVLYQGIKPWFKQAMKLFGFANTNATNNASDDDNFYHVDRRATVVMRNYNGLFELVLSGTEILRLESWSALDKQLLQISAERHIHSWEILDISTNTMPKRIYKYVVCDEEIKTFTSEHQLHEAINEDKKVKKFDTQYISQCGTKYHKTYTVERQLAFWSYTYKKTPKSFDFATTQHFWHLPNYEAPTKAVNQDAPANCPN